MALICQLCFFRTLHFHEKLAQGVGLSIGRLQKQRKMFQLKKRSTRNSITNEISHTTEDRGLIRKMNMQVILNGFFSGETENHLKAQFYQQAKNTSDYICSHLYVCLGLDDKRERDQRIHVAIYNILSIIGIVRCSVRTLQTLI